MCPQEQGGRVSKRVLIFDSGVGGLSVYQEIRRVLPGLHYIYLFDNKCFPYGELPVETLIQRCCELIVGVAAHPDRSPHGQGNSEEREQSAEDLSPRLTHECLLPSPSPSAAPWQGHSEDPSG